MVWRHATDVLRILAGGLEMRNPLVAFSASGQPGDLPVTRLSLQTGQQSRHFLEGHRVLSVKECGRMAVVSFGMFLAACSAGGRAVQQGSSAYELVNGQWLNGDRFEARKMYVVAERLSTTRPSRIDSTVDLNGGYVVPPYGEAHNHWIEPDLVSTYNARYLREGVFYVSDLGTAPFIHARFDSMVPQPNGVDFRSAHQGWTGPGGHPIEVFDQLAAIGAFPRPSTPEALEEFLFVVETESEIDERWPKFLAGRPGMVKVFLASSDQYAQRRDDDSYGKHRGLDPALLPGLVRRAHSAGLPIAVHVETAADFHAAVLARVDWIAHLPYFEEERGGVAVPLVSLISEADAKLAAAQNIVVVPTISWVRAEHDDSVEVNRIYRELVVPNLRMLKANGVTLVVGSDQFRKSSVVEAMALAETGVFTNAELLRLWTETTPRAIFPDRRIGRLQDGFEASFLVLEGDPLEDFAQSLRIRRSMKQGAWLAPSETEAEWPPLPGS
jgi:hypothetical protein